MIYNLDVGNCQVGKPALALYWVYGFDGLLYYLFGGYEGGERILNGPIALRLVLQLVFFSFCQNKLAQPLSSFCQPPVEHMYGGKLSVVSYTRVRPLLGARGECVRAP